MQAMLVMLVLVLAVIAAVIERRPPHHRGRASFRQLRRCGSTCARRSPCQHALNAVARPLERQEAADVARARRDQMAVDLEESLRRLQRLPLDISNGDTASPSNSTASLSNGSATSLSNSGNSGNRNRTLNAVNVAARGPAPAATETCLPRTFIRAGTRAAAHGRGRHAVLPGRDHRLGHARGHSHARGQRRRLLLRYDTGACLSLLVAALHRLCLLLATAMATVTKRA